MLLSSRLKGIKNERATVKLLLEAAARCDQAGPDAKAEALLGWIYRLQAEEGDPNLKILIFTEFVSTQDMLHRFLADRGFQSVTLNGSMSLEERKKAQDQFAGDSRFLISTDAGGEGLNLQFCHVVINYDLPWNPMRLEQRIGRVDRIGQTHRVKAVNFVLEDSVEYRVREVLEEKLKVIFQEFGIDKTGDVLDSAQAGRIFNDLYLEAHLHPEKIEASVNNVITQVEEQVREYQETALVLGTTEDLKGEDVQRLLTHPLPYWVERMTVSYLGPGGERPSQKGRPGICSGRTGSGYRKQFSSEKPPKPSRQPAITPWKTPKSEIWLNGCLDLCPASRSRRFPSRACLTKLTDSGLYGRFLSRDTTYRGRAFQRIPGREIPIRSDLKNGFYPCLFPLKEKLSSPRPATSGINY